MATDEKFPTGVAAVIVIALPQTFCEVSMPDQPLPSVSFDELSNTLLPLGTVNSPSELQGLLCGKLCGGANLTEVSWLLEAVEFLDFTSAPDEKVRHLLTRLFHATRLQLHSEFGLRLMLPDDESDMVERIAALGQWCHGFLTGFGTTGARNELSEDARDTLQDLAAIVHITADDEEEDEHDYMEVTEYVRMAATSLFYEFSPEPLPPPAQNLNPPVLH
ncbi:UPF0149 family protein [Cellvibrio polysaccharolyticus]|nr:UPF0149 family protein [Cellvibrio polysaccharolyticus]